MHKTNMHEKKRKTFSPPTPPKGPKNPHFLVFRGFSPVAPLILLGSKIWQGANFKPSKKPFERNFKIQNRPIGSRVISKNVTVFCRKLSFSGFGTVFILNFAIRPSRWIRLRDFFTAYTPISCYNVQEVLCRLIQWFSRYRHLNQHVFCSTRIKSIFNRENTMTCSSRSGKPIIEIFVQHLLLCLGSMSKKFCVDWFSGFRDIGIWRNAFFARLSWS